MTTGHAAAVLALLHTHPEGMTARELIKEICGEYGDRTNAIHSVLRRMRMSGRVQYVNLGASMKGLYFLTGVVVRHPLDNAMFRWDVTASAMLREEHAQASATS